MKTYRTIILSVVYGCETLSLTVREEHRVKMFENTVQRKMFGTKIKEVTGECRKLCIEELYHMHAFFTNYYLGYEVKEGEAVGHVAHVCERGGEYKVLIGKPEGKKQLETPRHKWYDNIKIELKATGQPGLDSYC
jgi:hypothetical protein